MSQRLVKTEALALNIIERVKRGMPVEDSRVELKRDWPEPAKAARRIAGHSNASFGADVLWIVGVDETSGVAGAKAEELANWWPSVISHFDGSAPSLTDIALHVDGKTISCLLFETNRPPYVVKNPQYGSSGGGAVSLEVPWREGTPIRTANRNDLIRMLVPTVAQPEIEVLGGYGELRTETNYPSDDVIGVGLSFHINAYLYPRDDATVVIPFHKCSCVLIDEAGHHSLDGFKFELRHPYGIHHSQGSVPDTATVESTSSELLAHGPGRCRAELRLVLDNEPDWLRNSDLVLRLSLFVINSELPVEFEAVLTDKEPHGKDVLKGWSIEARS